MITSPAQWSFVWAAYGLTALIVVGLIGWVAFDARRRRQALANLEARGVRRRSEG